MRIIIIFCLFFVACQQDYKPSYSKIEANLNNIENLHPSEQIIAQKLNNISQKFNIGLISSIALNEALEREKNMQIIASIPRGIYILGFIKNAKNFPFKPIFSDDWRESVIDSANFTREKFMEFLGDKNTTIIFYDNGDGSAINAARWAQKMDYMDVNILSGNFNAWREMGFEISFDMPECCK